MKSKQSIWSFCGHIPSTDRILFSHSRHTSKRYQSRQAIFFATLRRVAAASKALKILRHNVLFAILSLLATALPLLTENNSVLWASTLIYTIEEGDTLDSIAQRFKVSLAALIKINRFRDMDQAKRSIVRGESILIPEPDIVFASVGKQGIQKDTVPVPGQQAPGDPDTPSRSQPPIQSAQVAPLSETPTAETPTAETPTAETPTAETPTAVTPTAVTPTAVTPTAVTPTAVPSDKEKSVSRQDLKRRKEPYKVQSGDTLSSLALRFKISSARLRQVNDLDGDKIRIGQILKIPNANQENDETAQPDPSDPILLSATTRLNSEINPSATTAEKTYTVKKGDTLLGISRKTKVSIGVIRSLNQLEDDYIRPGQVLRISSYDQAVRTIAQNLQGSPGSQYYNVERGDTLSSISRKFDVSLSQLLQWNQLKNADTINVGQPIQISPSTAVHSDASSVDKPIEYEEYEVVDGDTLWSIARRSNLSVSELRRYNPNIGKVLRLGQTLSVGPRGQAAEIQDKNPGEDTPYSKPSDTKPSDSKPSDDKLTSNIPPNAYISKQEAEAEQRASEEEEAYRQLAVRKRQKVKVNPPFSQPRIPEGKNRPVELSAYFTRNAPRVPRQPNVSYYEEFTDDPLENYQTARELMAQFDKELEAMPALGDDLKGYSFLIDPGHGGLDPGFNAQAEDGNGNPLYIIEDEYNYDYALRLYRKLRRNGAQVALTVISPNQLIIDSTDASRTLVSQKNEVYNSPFINQRGEYSSWPSGTASGLHKRVEVAESFFNGTPKNKRIFISLHNDNSPWDTDGRLVLYYNDSLTVDKLGRQFAEHMIPYLGKNAHVRGQNLAVLRKNPARFAVLVELRNIAYPSNTWAIRNADLRQEDIEMLTKGILSFVSSLKE